MSKKIMCVGEVLWDALPKGLFLGGAPFNVASHLTMLGEDVVMCSKVGNDILAKQAIKRAKEKELDIDFIQIDNDHETGIVDVTLDNSGNASYTIVEPAAWDFIQINNDLLNEAKGCKILVYGTLAQRNKTSRDTIEKLRSLGMINVYDVNLRPPYLNVEIIEKSLSDANIVKMNDDELTKMSDWFGLSKELKTCMVEITEKYHIETICITKGAKGAAIIHKSDFTEHNGYSVKEKDTVGAGDAFLAALIYGIMNKKENYEILEFANGIGAYVTTENGATPELKFDRINEILASKTE